MAVLSIIERELRVALRKKRPRSTRLAWAGGCTALTCGLVLLSGVTGNRKLGQNLHHVFCLLGFLVVLRAPRGLAGVFAEERRNQTLGLLFLSGLGPGEVFISKVFSSTLVAFTGLLAIFPMLAFPFLIGGVSFELFTATVTALPVLLLFTVSIVLLASVLTRDEGSAVLLGWVLLALLCAVTPALYYGQSQLAAGSLPSAWWLRLSPAYGPYLLGTDLRGANISEVWRNLGVTALWSLLCLGIAGTSLKRVWRDRDEAVAAPAWSDRLREFFCGAAAHRKRLAELSPVSSPFAWLSARNRQPVATAWMFLTGAALAWLVCWAAWGHFWATVPNFFITATLLNLGMGWFTRFTAARHIADGRRDGGYELLLTTSLRPDEIVTGELEAVRFLFQRLWRAILGLEIALALAGLALRQWNWRSLYVYSIAWAILLGWSWAAGRNWRRLLPVMWASLNCARPAHAVWRTSGLGGWWWVWMLFNVRWAVSGLPRFPSGSTNEVIVASICLVAFLLILLGQLARLKNPADMCEKRLLLEFREVAREPLPDPDDPRFKQWDPKERFPWGWERIQEQLHERAARRKPKDSHSWV